MYLEGGDICALARIRAPQARPKKWCHCAASFEDKFAYKQNTMHLKSQQAVPWEWWWNVREHVIWRRMQKFQILARVVMEILGLAVQFSFLCCCFFVYYSGTWFAVFIWLLFLRHNFYGVSMKTLLELRPGFRTSTKRTTTTFKSTPTKQPSNHAEQQLYYRHLCTFVCLRLVLWHYPALYN